MTLTDRHTYIPTCFSFKVAELLKILTDGSISVAVGDKLSTLVVRKTGSAIDLVNKVGNLKKYQNSSLSK